MQFPHSYETRSYDLPPPVLSQGLTKVGGALATLDCWGNKYARERPETMPGLLGPGLFFPSQCPQLFQCCPGNMEGKETDFLGNYRLNVSLWKILF